MSIPAYTAESSLNREVGHFQTSRNRTNLRTQIIGSIAPALGISDEGIEVHSCRPGFIQLGEGPNMVCIDPGDPFGTRGHEGPGETGPGRGEPTDGGRGGKRPKPPKKDANGCYPEQIQSDAAGPCFVLINKDISNGVKNVHYVRCVGKKLGCCQNYVGTDGKRHRNCTPLS